MRRTIFEGFSKEMEHLMERFFGEPGSAPVQQAFKPSTNVAETDTAYEVTVDLPGMKLENVKVEVQQGQLRVSGMRESLHTEKEKTFHRMERTYGEFRRVIPLPGGVDDDKIEAVYRDGVLSITLPKTEKERPRQIEVKSSPMGGGHQDSM